MRASEYGYDPDDWAPVIQLALDWGASILYFRPGTYRLKSPVVIPKPPPESSEPT